MFGEHSGYIIAAWSVGVVVIGALIATTMIEHRALKARLADLESRGLRRRSARPETPAS